MTGNPEFKRYLVNIDSASTQQLFTDCLVGAGIAGLRAAIEAANHRSKNLIKLTTYLKDFACSCKP